MSPDPKETILETSDDKLTTIRTQNLNGDATIDRQTITAKSISALGVTTVTISDYAGGVFNDTLAHHVQGAKLLDRQTTETCADQRTVTMHLDQDGNGQDDLMQMTPVGLDGTKTTTTTFYSRGNSTLAGGVEATDVVTVSGNGLVRTEAVDRNADGRVDLFTTDTTVLNDDGSMSRSFEHHNDRYVTLGTEEYYKSDDGLYSSVTIDLNGDGVIESRSEDQTVYQADDDVLRTQTSFDEFSNQTAPISTLTSGNGLVTTISADYTGDGNIDRLSILTKDADGSWSSLTRYLGAGNHLQGTATDLVDSTFESMSADGRTHLIENDLDGDGFIDRRVVSTEDSNQTTTTLFEDLAKDGSADKTITETALANGTDTEFAMDFNGDGAADLTRVSTTSYNSATASVDAGAKVETFEELYPTGRAGYVQTTTTSADGLKVTTTFDIDGNGTTDGPKPCAAAKALQTLRNPKAALKVLSAAAYPWPSWHRPFSAPSSTAPSPPSGRPIA